MGDSTELVGGISVRGILSVNLLCLTVSHKKAYCSMGVTVCINIMEREVNLEYNG